MKDIHSCSYFCTRPVCVMAQRDELRERLAVGELAASVQQSAARNPPSEGEIVSALLANGWQGNYATWMFPVIARTFRQLTARGEA